MASFNRVIIMGNLTRDPDYKQLASGHAVCRLGIASNRQFKNKQSGSMVQEVCYVDIDVWGAQAESCRQFLQKGRAVLIEGRLKLDTWEDQEGKNRSKHSIVADRVVFVSSGSGSEVDSSDQESAGSSPRVEGARFDNDAQIDQALSEQINEVKSRQKPKAKKQTDTAGDQFKDEPPFKDDLPF